jgi:hypothetical protein
LKLAGWQEMVRNKGGTTEVYVNNFSNALFSLKK